MRTGELTPEEHARDGLPDREVEVLRLIARGRTNKQVAASSHLPAKAGRVHHPGHQPVVQPSSPGTIAPMPA
jgi:DNA-binding NarL/FixJ family response regulator